MEIFTNHIIDWLILLIFFGLVIYTLRVIGQEKSTFRDDSFEVQFGKLRLTIPNWWSIVQKKDHSLRFERTDAKYDWYASFAYFPDSQNKSIPTLLEEKLNLEKIEFDINVVFETDSRVLFRDSEIQEYFQEMVRVEGEGSEDVENRIYYDIYIMRSQNDSGYFIFESKSSILSGSIEGPYFEESLAELSFILEA